MVKKEKMLWIKLGHAIDDKVNLNLRVDKNIGGNVS